MIRDISVIIAGQAGDGVLFTGNILAKLLKRQGWEVVTTRDFPSNIRGEETSYIIRASLNRIHGRDDTAHILLAFDCEAIRKHIKSVAKNGVVLCDGEGIADLPAFQKREKTFHRLMLRQMARDNFGHEIYKNMIALGALGHILDMDASILTGLLKEMFLMTCDQTGKDSRKSWKNFVDRFIFRDAS